MTPAEPYLGEALRCQRQIAAVAPADQFAVEIELVVQACGQRAGLDDGAVRDADDVGREPVARIATNPADALLEQS